MPHLTDTTPEAELILREAYRRMPFARRWQQMGSIYRLARSLHAAGVQDRNPDATPLEIEESWRQEALGSELSPPSGDDQMATNDEGAQVIQEVIAVLDRLEIPYALGGSWASSLLGKMRFTHDADLTVEPFAGQEGAFCAAFNDDYYVSPPAVREAIGRRSTFNVIHTPSAFKVDFFVRKARPF